MVKILYFKRLHLFRLLSAVEAGEILCKYRKFFLIKRYFHRFFVHFG